MNQVLDKNKELVSDVKTLIEQSKQQVSIAVNATITLLYWQIGNRINKEILNDQRAEYGQQIVATLWRQLVTDYGTAFSEKNLRRMMQFASVFPDLEIVSKLWRQLSWSHFKIIIPIEDPLKRMFYIEMCKIEKWSVRTFQDKINSLLYERTAISKLPEETIKNDLKTLNESNQLTHDLVFRNHNFMALKNQIHAFRK